MPKQNQKPCDVKYLTMEEKKEHFKEYKYTNRQHYNAMISMNWMYDNTNLDDYI